MKYIAVFDIPDGNGIGCAYAKTAPNDGKVKCDADFETVYANTTKMDDYFAPKYLEIPFYRRLVLDHMECACTINRERRKELDDPETVWKETVRISKARTQKDIQARYAYYYGQLALLDYIQRMQNEYVAPAASKYPHEGSAR